MDIEKIIERLKEDQGLNNDNEVAELLGMKTSNFSARKKSGSLFCVISEWGTRNDIDLNSLLKGETKKRSAVDNELIADIDQWLSGLVEKEPGRKEWFKHNFEDAFPAFKEWKQRKEENEGHSSEFPNSKAV